MRRAFVLLLALALLPLLPAATASHFQTYGNYPSEHDDFGSSDEPDFDGTTSVLGVPVTERVLDTNLDGLAEPSAMFPNGVLAPGCTDDSGRQANGLCGLWTIGALNGEGTDSGLGVPPRTLGVERGPAPGLMGRSPVRILDHHATLQVPDNLATGGVYYIEFNKKSQDSGAAGALAAVDPSLGGKALVYQSAQWVWYGEWTDRNGNGVIDALQAGRATSTNPPQPILNPDNEFRWFGNCYSFDGVTREGWHCFNEERARGYRQTGAGYVFPGNHHSYCGLYPLLSVREIGPAGEACGFVGGDLPGARPLCFADAATYPVANAVLKPATGEDAAGGLVTLLTDRCYARDVSEVDPNEGDWEGDPIFGVQDSIAPDELLTDRSGDDYWDTRMWFYGASPITYYDQSLVTSTFVITTIDCAPDPASRRAFVLGTCRFLDVDHYRTWNPLLESLVASTKPMARGQYEFVRDSNPGPALRGLDGQLGNARTDTRPVTGPVDDDLVNPGWSREPNHALDRFPGATLGVCASGDATHNGWCNRYAGHRGGEALFGDARLTRVLTYDRAMTVSALGPGCTPCQSGPGLVFNESPEPMPGALPRPDGDHARSLGAGGYYASGSLGYWRDRPQSWTEEFLDLEPGSPTFGTPVRRDYTAAADGWVGNVVNLTGTFHYRGYDDESCATENGAGTYPYAVCRPYLDGTLQDAQQFGAGDHGEWRGACQEVPLSQASFKVRPVGGVWTVPVFVLERHNTLDVPSSFTNGQLRDYTGTSQALELIADCGTSFWGGVHFLYLPLGNLGLNVETEFRGTAAAGTLVDVDGYRAWGA